MSNIYKDGKLVNPLGHGTTDGQGKSRYSNADLTVIDWWATHVKPEVVKVEEKAKEVVAAVETEVKKVVTEVKAEATHLWTEADVEALRKSDNKDATAAAIAQPPYEDEHGKTWLYNPATNKWDIPAPETVNEAAPSNPDVPQV